jgi:starch phosphorylase
MDIKYDNKKVLADYIYGTTGVPVNGVSLFDAQIKRIHEYKRQLLFIFYIISQYLKVKREKNYAFVPRTFIFSGKAAPGYFMAKLIIKFINNVSTIINGDKEVNNIMNVVFLENYGVSLAEKIFRASDLSEQISTAGTEASGTGCMKFMVNGALTIGTLDGANIEIADCVGRDNIFIFGLKAEEISKIRSRGYHPQAYIERSGCLKEILYLIKSNFFSTEEQDIFDPLVNNLIYSDPFFICADFESYCSTQDKVSQLYVKKNEWAKKSILNVARSGKFSSDRTIIEYNNDIWKASCGENVSRLLSLGGHNV